MAKDFICPSCRTEAESAGPCARCGAGVVERASFDLAVASGRTDSFRKWVPISLGLLLGVVTIVIGNSEALRALTGLSRRGLRAAALLGMVGAFLAVRTAYQRARSRRGAP